MNFSDSGMYGIVLDNGLINIPGKFEPENFKTFQENPKKLIFWKLLKKKSDFFRENRALSLFSPYNDLTLCTEANKSLDPNSRKSAN